jgi:hypothetical protein
VETPVERDVNNSGDAGNGRDTNNSRDYNNSRDPRTPTAALSSPTAESTATKQSTPTAEATGASRPATLAWTLATEEMLTAERTPTTADRRLYLPVRRPQMSPFF